MRFGIAFAFLLILISCTNGLFRSGSGGSSGIFGQYPNGYVNTITYHSAKGLMYIAGEFTTVGDFPYGRIARYFLDGSLDTSFNVGTGFDDEVFAVLVTDGDIFVGGEFINYQSTARQHLARLEVDGDINTSFLPGTGPNESVGHIIPATNSGAALYIAGAFTSFSGAARNKIAKLSVLGGTDLSFLSVPGATNGNMVFMTQNTAPDYEIFAVGSFTTYDGVVSNRLTGIGTDGSGYPPFSTSLGLDGIARMAIRQNGYILVGDFTDFESTPTDRVVTINSDGTLLQAYNPGFDASVMTITEDNGGGYYFVGGSFDDYAAGGLGLGGIARWNTDGSIDTQFNAGGTGFNGQVRFIQRDINGKLYVGGNFTSFNSFHTPYIVRLNSDGSFDSTFLDPAS